jgi:hypothetical protein
MSGLLRRIRSARPTASDPDPGQPDPTWTEAWEPAHAPDPDAHAAEGEPPPPADGREPEAEPEQPPVPAGVDLDALVGERPTTRRRGRLRRRLRHLRRVREVLLRDLGGLVFEIHRSGTAGAEEQSRLVGGKLARLGSVDAELRELEEILSDRRAMVLREPGIGGSCPLCGELFGSDARFCWACGTPVAPGAARPVVASSAEALPQIGAAAHEGTPSHVWNEPARDEAPTQPEPHVEGSSAEPHVEGSSAEPHVEGSSEEITERHP